MESGLTICRVIAVIGLSFIAGPAHAYDLETIAGNPTHDTLGETVVTVGVKNKETTAFKMIRVECRIYRGSDLVGAGHAVVEWVYPGQTAYGIVETFDEAAAKADKADCRVSGVVLEKWEREVSGRIYRSTGLSVLTDNRVRQHDHPNSVSLG